MGKAIILTDCDFSAKNVGQVTFSNIPLQSLSINGDSSIIGSATYTPVYSPSYTTQKGVAWSIVDGSAYATIDSSTGVVTAKTGALTNNVTIRCTSTQNSSIYADKTISVSASQIPNTITATATSYSVSVGLAYAAESALTITVGTLGTISIASGASSGTLSISSSSSERTAALSVSPTSDGVYSYEFASSTITIPATLNLKIVGPIDAISGDVRAGNYFLLDVDTMKQVVGTQGEVTDDYKEYLGAITWSITAGSTYVTLEANSGTRGDVTILSGANQTSFTITALCNGTLVSMNGIATYVVSDLVISSFQDMQSFASALNNSTESNLIPSATNGQGFSGKHIRLGSDIDYNNSWIQIGYLYVKTYNGSNNKPFKGWFDGAGYTIKNIGTPDKPTTPSGSTYMGGVLFQVLQDAKVSNFRLEADLNIPSSWSGTNYTLFVLSAISYSTEFSRIFINAEYSGQKLWQIGTISRNDSTHLDSITDIVQTGYYESNNYAWGATTSVNVAKRCADMSIWKSNDTRVFYCASETSHKVEDMLFMGDTTTGNWGILYSCQKNYIDVTRFLACGTLSNTNRKYLCGGTDYTLDLSEVYYESGKTSFTSTNRATGKTKQEIQSGSLFGNDNWIEKSGFYPILNNQFAITPEVLDVAKNGSVQNS